MGFLRYFLASLVLVSHLGHTVLDGINPGVSAVVVFYMLAGHVVAGLWQKWHALPGAMGRFYADRLWRVMPQYALACLAAALLWKAGAQSPFLAQQQPGPLHWLAQITIVPLAYYMYTGADNFVLLPPAWSLGVELQFYVLAPLVVLAPMRLFAVVMAASLGVFLAAQAQWLNPDHFGYRLLPGVLFLFLTGAALRRHNMPKTLAVLWVGMCVYLGFIWEQPPVPYRRDVALGFVLGLPLLALLQYRGSHAGTFALAAACPPAPTLLPMPSWRSALQALDRLLANASYGVFLWHFPVLWAMALARWAPASRTKGELLAVWLLSTACALMAHYAVERPLWHRQRRTWSAASNALPGQTESPRILDQ